MTKNTAQKESGFAHQNFSRAKEKQVGYNNYIDPEAFVEGIWEDSPNSHKNENVEKNRLESVENVWENGIIDYNKEQQNIFDVDSLPEQMHHFATNKNLKYTPQFNKIVSKYGLNLNGDWNKQLMRHRGRHPNEYHKYILIKMKIIDNNSNGDADLFIQKFNEIKKEIFDNPYMLRKAFWKGRKNEILLDDL